MFSFDLVCAKVTFKVQHDIVSGLKYVNSVYRKGVRGILNTIHPRRPGAHSSRFLSQS